MTASSPSELGATDHLRGFVETWAAHCGAPARTFKGQLAVTLHAELERAMRYAVHLEECTTFDLDLEAPADDAHCTCGLALLVRYVERLAPKTRGAGSAR